MDAPPPPPKLRTLNTVTLLDLFVLRKVNVTETLTLFNKSMQRWSLGAGIDFFFFSFFGASGDVIPTKETKKAV